MNASHSPKIVLFFSLLLAVLIIVVNGAGLAMPAALYAKDIAAWYAQSAGYDIANIFIAVPLLIITSVLAYRQNRKALLLWAGVLLYLIFIFAIYCFGIHFNQLFIVYCTILGLAMYLFLWFILTFYQTNAMSWFEPTAPTTIAGIYIMGMGSIFSIIWLLQILPANIKNSLPAELITTGHFTNPVHILGLSIYFPGILLTGFLVYRKYSTGLIMAPVILMFFLLICLSMGIVFISMKGKELETAVLISTMMFLLAANSAILLLVYLDSMKKAGNT